MTLRLWALLGLLGATAFSFDAGPNWTAADKAGWLLAQAEELGDVAWVHDWDAAVAESTRSGKPLLILFTEAEGCSTVRGYGNGVLRHPLIVDAAETLFVPVVVYNNVAGADRAVLESFGERSWNNPVVRIMTAERVELVPRMARDYTVGRLSADMRDALDSLGATVPTWLRSLAEVGLAPQGEFRGSDEDDRHQLRRTPWRFVPMTAAQATRANAALRDRRDPTALFSPRQRRLAQLAALHPDAGWPETLGRGEIVAEWRAAMAVLGGT